MKTFIVTIKLGNLKNHNPRKKNTGKCRHDHNHQCTDITGSHHSFLHFEKDMSKPINEIMNFYQSLGHHVTRVEEIVA